MSCYYYSSSLVLLIFLLFGSNYSSSLITDVFDAGSYKTSSYAYNCSVKPPKPLLIATPNEAGEFPIVLFLHGYLLYNSFYSQLIQRIASHGFIVIAPQLYEVSLADASGEIHSAADVVNWLNEGALSKCLPQNVKPNLDKLALAGHSRGGKVAFALALEKLGVTTDLKFSAIIGVDPVDGNGIYPQVLTHVNHSFDLDHMPALVIGTGLGEEAKFLLPACAPKGVNHVEFFDECQKPAWHFVATDYGHVDMLDDFDQISIWDWARWSLTTSPCVQHGNGNERGPMRSFTGGVIVSFLRAYFMGDTTDLLAIRDGGSKKAPVNFTVNYNLSTNVAVV